MPTIFGDSMVIQQDKPVHVWGWTEAGTEVTVALDDQSATATAGDDGRFDVELPAVKADGQSHQMTVKSHADAVTIDDVLYGEVWVCSGQSNMQWPVNAAADPDLEKLTAKFPKIRIITVPNRASQKPERNFDGSWTSVTPQTVGDFTAVGYYFGRQLHQTLDVPIGLIDNAWGGSAAEAWVPWESLEGEALYEPLVQKYRDLESNYDHAAVQANYQTRLEQWVENGKKGNRPRAPRNPMTGNHRIANLYYGCLTPIIGFPIRGVIWYQGESNSGRAYQYRDLFPRMIQKWRSDWNQGDFPFYWVQLADFRNEVDQPGDSSWAELREAQTMATSLPNTGQAVIVDLGEASDIHPRDKQNVAKRLARLALSNDYGLDVTGESPTFEKASFNDGKATIDFANVGGGLDTFDVPKIKGFVIAGDDKTFVPADAKIVDRDTVEVSSPDVSNPVAVRYGWADNPIVNFQNKEGLPVTPFRTDDFKGVTEGVLK